MWLLLLFLLVIFLNHGKVPQEDSGTRLASRSAQTPDPLQVCARGILEWSPRRSSPSFGSSAVLESTPLSLFIGQTGYPEVAATTPAVARRWNNGLSGQARMVWAMLCQSFSESSVLPDMWKQFTDVYCPGLTRQSGVEAVIAEEKNVTEAKTTRGRSSAQGAEHRQGQAAAATQGRQEQRQGQSAGCCGLAPTCSCPGYLDAEAGNHQWTRHLRRRRTFGGAALGDAGSLPSSLAERVQSFQATNAKSTGKLFHKQVARQTEARTQLQKLARDRQTFLEGWAEYLQVLTTTVEQQVEKMSKVLGDFDTAEIQWQAQLSEATDMLSKASSGSPPAPRSAEAMEAEDAEVAQAAAEESGSRLQVDKIRQGQQELVAALNKAKAAAEIQRDGSRTPRRKPRDTDIVDLEQQPPQ